MVDPGALHILLLSLAALVTAGLAGYAWHHGDEPGARGLSAAMVGVTLWTVTEIFALSETWAAHLFWERVQWLAIAVVPLFFFFFIVDFTGYGWILAPRYVPLFFVVPAVSVVLVWTNPVHHLMWTHPVSIHTGGIVTLDQQFGPWFWIYFVYAYTLLFVGFALLVRLVVVSEYLYFDQAFLIVVGILAPLAGNAFSVFGVAPLPGLDLTPYGFTITGIAFGNALFRYRLFDLLPATRRLGRQAALVNLVDGIVIVDADRRVLYLNPAASEILDCDLDESLGESLQTLVDTGTLDFAASERLADLSIDDRIYEVETTPISDRHDRHVGHTVLLYDVTERERRETELRTQRDRFRRLERISTVVRDVNKALISATTVEDLQCAVVETLAVPELYDDVWLSTSASDGPPVRMSADDDDPDPVEPDDDPTLPESIAVDAPARSDRTPTTDPEWATVALVYGRTVYGVLAVHTTRENGFGERERDVLNELGETVGHALTALERTHLLVADTRTEVGFESTDERSLLVALAGATDLRWTLDGLVPARGGDLVAYLSTDAPDAGVAEAAAHPGVSEVRSLETDDGTALEVRAHEGLLAHPLVEHGTNVRTATAVDGRCHLTVELAPDVHVRAVVERVREEFPETTLTTKQEIEPTDGDGVPRTEMTDRQREALEAAFRAGYFDWPRESTAEDVAASLDISSATLHGHLRKAENQLLRSFFED